MNEGEKETAIGMAVRLLTALRALQAVAGITEMEMLGVALDAGARFDDIEAVYSRRLAAYGAFSTPTSAAEWEALCRRMWDLRQ